MDTYRGRFSDQSDDHAHASTGQGEDWPEVEFGDEDAPREAPPSPVGQDERRMQVRAYNHWASLLDNRNFPSIEDLRPDDLPDFGPYSVLLDFTAGIENPAIQFLGDQLGHECGADGVIESLSDVPARSLLSRITDHYMQILANQAPIGFEAEFVNQREQTILYRGILLPFSSDDDNIDFIYGVINWKELVDQQTTDGLLQEIDQALELSGPANPHADLPLTDWADLAVGPAGESETSDEAVFDLVELAPESEVDDVLELGSADEFAEPAETPGGDSMGLADYLASARELAELARGSEDRTRHALYAAIGRAYDFSLAAEEVPGEFAELVEDFGLTVQDRAPMTPVVKLVFGSEYDKTRLTEYASALGHARRIGLGRGALADYLGTAPGGLKGVVAEERRLKKADSGKPADPRDNPREALARKLRQLDYQPLDQVSAHGSEFTLLVARRLPSGEVVLLGELSDDIPLLERAVRKLL